MGLPQSPNSAAPQTSSHGVIFGVIGFFILYTILHFLVNSQRRRVTSGLEKVNLRENSNNFDGMM